jgi:hypothetical protein
MPRVVFVSLDLKCRLWVEIVRDVEGKVSLVPGTRIA